MYKKILVPVDGSPDSERVLDWVKPFARLGADIHLVTIVDSRHLAQAHEFAQLTESITEWADQYLAGLLKEVQQEFPSASASRGTGGPAREILRIAGEVDADLIAMETHRGSAVVRGIVGSCTDAVVRSGKLPVLVLPPGGASVTAPDKPSTILVPLDGSDLAEHGLELGIELAKAFEANLSLVRAVSANAYGGSIYGMDHGFDASQAWSDAVQSQEKEAGDYLNTQANRVKAAGLSVMTAVPTDTGAGSVIDALDDSPSTRAVMATHGRGGIKRLVLGSVTDKVIRSSNAPVLVIPANSISDANEAETDV